MRARVLSSILIMAAYVGICFPIRAQQKTTAKNPIRWHLKRIAEPRENAFSMLIPDGWKFDGGVLRINPLTANGPGNAIDAKFDFRIRRDSEDSVLMHWLPSYYYKDSRYLAYASMYFPPGSNYMGMEVCHLMDPEFFLMRRIFPAEHPYAREIEILDRQPLGEIIARYRETAISIAGLGSIRYEGVSLLIRYREGNTVYRERMMALIEDMGTLGVGLWSNKETLLMRAPEAEFEEMEPLFARIQTSIQPDAGWVAAERLASAERSHIVLKTQRYIQHVTQEMLEHRRRTNAAIDSWNDPNHDRNPRGKEHGRSQKRHF